MINKRRIVVEVFGSNCYIIQANDKRYKRHSDHITIYHSKDTEIENKAKDKDDHFDKC